VLDGDEGLWAMEGVGEVEHRLRSAVAFWLSCER
jgi:hypothetical protein